MYYKNLFLYCLSCSVTILLSDYLKCMVGTAVNSIAEWECLVGFMILETR